MEIENNLNKSGINLITKKIKKILDINNQAEAVPKKLLKRLIKKIREGNFSYEETSPIDDPPKFQEEIKNYDIISKNFHVYE